MARVAAQAARGAGGYDRGSLISDLIAGLTVGVVALPLAMAFGIASGVSPQAGIYTAIVGGFVVSVLGGTCIQIAGPTGAFVVIVAGIIGKHGFAGLLMVTMMAGVILLFLALTGLGQAVKFIPRPVVLGFTNGIALLIASTQIKDFLGLALPTRRASSSSACRSSRRRWSTLNPAASALSLVSLALILLVPTLAAADPWLDRGAGPGHGGRCRPQLPVETIGSRFGGIPAGLPPIAIPEFRSDLISRCCPRP